MAAPDGSEALTVTETAAAGCRSAGMSQTRSTHSRLPGSALFERVDFRAAQPVGQLVQYAIDVLVAIGRTKRLGQLDSFVEHYTVRHVNTLAELPGGKAQNGQLDRIQLANAAVQILVNHFVQLGYLMGNGPQALTEVFAINAGKVVIDLKLGFDIVQVLLGDLPLVYRLHQQRARHAAFGNSASGAWRWVVAVVVVVKTHLASSCASRLTISRADRAASAPLLPALVPERSMACSMLSTVSTPKATGIPDSRDTAPTPLTHSPATYSKCGVPPRMTAPRVMMASYCLRSATLRTISGISKAPGTRTMVMSDSLTP